MPKFAKISQDGKTLQLAETESPLNGCYDGHLLLIVLGTGAGNFRFIKNYEGSTKTVTISPFDPALDDTSVYRLIPFC